MVRAFHHSNRRVTKTAGVREIYQQYSLLQCSTELWKALEYKCESKVLISVLSLIFFRFIYFTCMYAWPTCIYVYHTHSSCLWRSEEGIRSPEVRVMDDREPLHGCWESNMGPLHEQQVLLTTEPSPSFSVANFHNQIISSFFSSPTVVKCSLHYLLWFYWNILFFKYNYSW